MFKEENFGEIHIPQEAIKSESEKLKAWNERQIDLAIELFELVIGSKIDRNNKEDTRSAMEYWIEEGYSELYRNLEKENPSGMTAKDILQYKQGQNLQE